MIDAPPSTPTSGAVGEAEPLVSPVGPAGVDRRSVHRTIAVVLIAAIGMYVMMLTLSTALSLRIATIDPTNKETTYGLAVSVGALLMLVTVPLGGALSDRTTSRYGRRRPWIVGCLVPALLAAAVIGLVSSIPVIMIAYVVGIATAQVAFNSYAVIPVEAVPDRMRARVMGLMGLFGALAFSAGSYLAAWLVHAPLLMMTVPVLLAIVTSLPLLVLYQDPAKAATEVPPLNVAGMARGFLVDPRKHPDFAWAWISRFLAGVAMTALFAFFIYFMMDGLGLSIAEAGRSAGLLTLTSAPISIVFFTLSGWLSDKIGRRKPFVTVAALLMALALVVAATASTFSQFLIAWMIFAVGQATYLTVDLALCAAVLPDARDAGKDMAVFGLALNIPNILVPAVAPIVLTIGAGHNYQVLWIGAAVLCALGALTVTRITTAR